MVVAVYSSASCCLCTDILVYVLGFFPMIFYKMPYLFLTTNIVNFSEANVWTDRLTRFMVLLQNHISHSKI